MVCAGTRARFASGLGVRRAPSCVNDVARVLVSYEAVSQSNFDQDLAENIASYIGPAAERCANFRLCREVVWVEKETIDRFTFLEGGARCWKTLALKK